MKKPSPARQPLRTVAAASLAHVGGGEEKKTPPPQPAPTPTPPASDVYLDYKLRDVIVSSY